MPTQSRTITAEPLTAEAFAPFGTLLTWEGRERLPINAYGEGFDVYREPLESDQPMEWLIVHADRRPTDVLFLERHVQLTQAFVPLNGSFVTVVAEPAAPLVDGVPSLDAVRAFVVPEGVGIQVHRGTWHENPIPLTDDLTILVTGHQALTRGHVAHGDRSLEAYDLDVEKHALADAGLALEVAVA